MWKDAVTLVRTTKFNQELAKLVAEDTRKILRKLREEPDMDTRFKGQIFMGAGEISEAHCYRLHKMLDRAFGILGGMQQNGLQGANDVRVDNFQIEDIASQIYLALTGRLVPTRNRIETLRKAGVDI